MDKQKELGTESVGRLLLKYSIPAIIGMVINSLYNVVDRMFIGHIPGIGNLAITGVGLTTPVITIVLGFAMLVGIGATACISIKLGQGKKEEAEHVLGNAFSLGTIIGIILMIGGMLFAGNLLAVFGGDATTIPYGVEYINIFLMGTIFNVIGFISTSTMRADGSPMMSAICMVIGCGLNVVLDAVLIFGLDMGIKGAALATIISQFVTAVIGVYYFTKGKSNLKLKKAHLPLDMNMVKNITVIGSAPCAMQMAISLVQVIMNRVLSTTGGQEAIGAMAAINAIVMLVLMPIFGINQGAQPIIGYNYGAKLYNRSKTTSILAIASATVILIIGFVIIRLAPSAFVSMFDGEGTLMDVAVPGIKLYTLSLPIIAIPIMGSNYFQAIGKAKLATCLSLLRQVIILIPVIMVSSRIGGLEGTWLAQPISDVICSFIIGIIIIREFRSYDKVSNVAAVQEA